MKRTEVGRYWEENAETWTRHARVGYDIYRDGLNTPAFLDMLPPVRGLRGLDIGCGEGSNTRELVRLGARMHAIDVAPTFIRYAHDAEKAKPLGIAYVVADATDLPFATGSFHFCDGFHVDDGHGQPRRCLVRGGTGIATGRFPSILDPASGCRQLAQKR